MIIKKIPIIEKPSKEIGFITLEHYGSDLYGIEISKIDNPFDINCLIDPISLALKESKAIHASKVIFRFIKNIHPAELIKHLPILGFSKKHNRIEYKKSLESFSDEVNSPLTWKTTKELSLTEESVFEILSTVTDGDPDQDVLEDLPALIQDILYSKDLTSGFDCIHIGFVNKEIAAFTAIQMSPKNKWARISYMGIIPKFRGLGFGKWVHYHSIQEIKKLGGLLYIGGTVSANTAMIKIFKSQNCEILHEMEEWVFTP